MLELIIAAPILQHRQIQIFGHLADVVLRRRLAVDVLMHRHPAVALRIGARGIETARGSGKGGHQGRIGSRDSRDSRVGMGTGSVNRPWIQGVGLQS